MAFVSGHALIIGVGSHSYATQLDAPVSAEDALEVAAALADPALCGYPEGQVEVLHDETATREGILAGLDRLAGRAGPEDTALLFYCGHGDYEPGGEYALFSHDARIIKQRSNGRGERRVEPGSGVSQSALLEKLRLIQARRLLVIFNACHAGQVAPTLGAGETPLGAQTLPDIAKDALLSTGQGRIVLAACREEQVSYIGDGQLSIFTQALVDALHGQDVAPRGGMISVFDLYLSVYERVSRQVRQKYPTPQDPELTILKGVGPFAVALYRGSPQVNPQQVEAAADLPRPAVRRVSPETSLRLYGQLIIQSAVTQIVNPVFHVTEEQAFQVHGLPNPYLGLSPYTYEERNRYAGREGAVREVVDRLASGAQRGVLFITGASGSGKSSFAQAGLLPAIEQLYQKRGQQARRAVFRPAGNPAAAFTSALIELGLEQPAARALTQDLPSRVGSALGAATPAQQVNLLVIDQFEECFTQASPDGRRWLFDCLAGFPPFGESRTCLIATLRSDYLDRLFEDPALWEMAKDGVELRAMSPADLKKTIQRPLQVDPRYEGKRFEPALLDCLADDAAQDSASLPLLQVALQELWTGGQLALARYKGLAGSIQEWAETVYAREDWNYQQERDRPPQERAELLSLLLDLVSVSPSDDQRKDVRIRRSRASLQAAASLREGLIDELTQARLLAVSADSSAPSKLAPDSAAFDKPGGWVDIIHESLLERWQRLKDSIEAEREQLRRRARFENALAEWRDHHQADGFLLADARLAEAQELARQNDIALSAAGAVEFLQRSQKQAEAETLRLLHLERAARRRTQWLAGVLGVFLLASLAWIAYPFLLSLQARGEMADIPAGQAILGPDASYAPARVGEAPLGPYSIDRYEVTNAQYRLCVRANRCSKPQITKDYEDRNRSDYPVISVSALQASEFCRWVGGRLPSEIEWERAARGPNGWPWPWGSAEPDGQHANLNYGQPALQPVNALPQGCTPEPERVCGTIGNAAEWTASWDHDDQAYHPEDVWDGRSTDPFLDVFFFYRGFDYKSKWSEQNTRATLATISQFAPFYEFRDSVGFRCAR